MVVCLAVGSQGGYKPKCRTIYETAYTTQYEQSCSTSYKTECSTSYQQHCSTEYQTEYEQKVKHIFIFLKNDFFYLFSSAPPVTRSNAPPVTRLPTRRSVQPLTKRFVLFSSKSDWTIFNFLFPNSLGLFLWSWRIRWIRKAM